MICYVGYENVGDLFEKKVICLVEYLGWKGKGLNFDILFLIY